MSTLLGTRQQMTPKLNFSSAQDPMNFFVEKAATIRRDSLGQTLNSTLPPAPATIDEFHTLLADDIQTVIMSAPTKSYAFDPLPTHVVEEFLPELLPYIIDMCDELLSQGIIPVSQRHAIITRG